MSVRKSITRLSSAERDRFTRGVHLLKNQLALFNGQAGNVYDWFVFAHETVMNDMSSGVHMGSRFLPWHRHFVALFEHAMQVALEDPTFAVPYWDWSENPYQPGLLKTPDVGSLVRAAVWGDDFMGGSGVGWDKVVLFGPFEPGNWPLYPPNVYPGLQRDFGHDAPTLPTRSDVQWALAQKSYDAPPWDDTSAAGFRNALEGFIPISGGGLLLHNRVHAWVGGSMNLPTPQTGRSPNDPVFFLHHSNVDRIWAQWQRANPTQTYPDPIIPDQKKFPNMNWGASLPMTPFLSGTDTATPSSVWGAQANYGLPWNGPTFTGSWRPMCPNETPDETPNDKYSWANLFQIPGWVADPQCPADKLTGGVASVKGLAGLDNAVVVNGAFGVTGDMTSYICLQGLSAPAQVFIKCGMQVTNDYEVWQGFIDAGAFTGSSRLDQADVIRNNYWFRLKPDWKPPYPSTDAPVFIATSKQPFTLWAFHGLVT